MLNGALACEIMYIAHVFLKAPRTRKTRASCASGPLTYKTWGCEEWAGPLCCSAAGSDLGTVCSRVRRPFPGGAAPTAGACEAPCLFLSFSVGGVRDLAAVLGEWQGVSRFAEAWFCHP